MANRFIYPLLLASVCGFNAGAQNEIDALRYSFTDFGGTARYMASGGAFGATGGDLSVMSTNPAGLGIYRKSEFTFTPAFFPRISTTTHYGNTVRDDKPNFNISNIGFVLTAMNENNSAYSSGWVSTSFAFGYHRLANFHSRVDIQGDNPQSSLLDDHILRIQGTYQSAVFNKDPFGAGLSWYSFLINPYDSIDTARYNSVIRNGGVQQHKATTTEGAMGETQFAFGANYANKLYIGATFGFPNINYREESSYTETDHKDTIWDFKSFAYNQSFNTSGTGFNFKLGFIYRPFDWLRLGFAVHTPSFLRLSDNYNSTMTSNFDLPDKNNKYSYTEKSPDGNFAWQLTTPMRLLGSVSFVIGKQGLFNADYEYIDYSNVRLRSSTYTFSTENNSIRKKYHGTVNLRTGIEWRYEVFRFRGGFAYYGSPYSINLNDGSRLHYTAGFGIRGEGWSLDFGYVLTQTKEDYYIYAPSLVSATAITSESHNILATIGFRF